MNGQNLNSVICKCRCKTVAFEGNVSNIIGHIFVRKFWNRFLQNSCLQYKAPSDSIRHLGEVNEGMKDSAGKYIWWSEISRGLWYESRQLDISTICRIYNAEFDNLLVNCVPSYFSEFDLTLHRNFDHWKICRN
jgi:hypothetical protein